MKAIKIVCGVLFGLLVKQASGYTITADPTYFSSGTELSTAFQGVTLSSLTITQQDTWSNSEIPEVSSMPIYSVLCSPCAQSTNGQYVFSPTATGNYGNSSSFYPSFGEEEDVARVLTGDAHVPGTVIGSAVFMAKFDHVTDYVQVIGGGATNANFYRLDAWGADGALLGTCVAFPGDYAGTPGCSQRQLGTTTTESAYTKDQWILGFQTDFSKIAFVTAGGYGGGQYVRSLAFSVPEPSALGILGAGLLVMMFAGRRVV